MELEDWAKRKCVPCKGTSPMTQEEAEKALLNFAGWTLENGSLAKEFRFHSYSDGLEFAYKVGKIAEEQDHHPDILVRWRRIKLTFSTHVIKGLSQNDFIMAAKSALQFEKYSIR